MGLSRTYLNTVTTTNSGAPQGRRQMRPRGLEGQAIFLPRRRGATAGACSEQ